MWQFSGDFSYPLSKIVIFGSIRRVFRKIVWGWGVELGCYLSGLLVLECGNYLS